MRLGFRTNQDLPGRPFTKFPKVVKNMLQTVSPLFFGSHYGFADLVFLFFNLNLKAKNRGSTAYQNLNYQKMIRETFLISQEKNDGAQLLVFDAYEEILVDCFP